jgi:uncharacterized protein
MIALQIIGGFIGLVIVYLIVIIFFPIMKVSPQPVTKHITKKEVPKNRQTVNFYVEDTKIMGWFYKPEITNEAPCIILSHGFAGTMDMELEQYAVKFSATGFAVLLYDYRTFGQSVGTPRQVYCGRYQIQDLKAAILYAKKRPEVDDSKIFLWGTSAAAGYGISVAGQDDSIAGIIAQCGAYDHKEDNKIYMDRLGFGFFIKLFIHGQRDKGRSRFNLSPHTFPAYGKEGTTAMLTAPGIFEGIQKLAENSPDFKNDVCARLALLPHAPDPIERAKTVKCKVLVQVCKKDTVVSPNSHVRMVENLGENALVKNYDIGHFDIYFDEHFDKATDDQLEFLGKLV